MTNRISNFIAKDERGRLFMKVFDKIETSKTLGYESENRFCPPHRLPHVPPLIGNKVEDEPCHAHATSWRYYTHHLPYCLLTRCPHLKAMIAAREAYFQ